MKLQYTPFIRQSVPITTEIEGYKPPYSSFIQEKSEEENIEEPQDTNPISNSEGEGVKIETPKIETQETETPIKDTTQSEEKKDQTKKDDEIFFKDRTEFKDTMISLYEKILAEKGLNPAFAKSLYGQDKLEASVSGNKRAGKYNLGGIKETRKGKGTISNTREVINGKDVYIDDSFRDFSSLEDYARYKVNLLNNSRYKAFSGDISEFASRVHRGGYATDPRYTEVLNKVIQSAKHGGVLKFQNGGEVAKTWLKNWYAGRGPQISKNFSNSVGFYVPKFLAGKYLNKAINSTTYQINPEIISHLPEGVVGAYSAALHDVAVKEDNPIVAVHEMTHATHNVPAEEAIAKIIDEMGGNIYELGTDYDEYLDKPSEIYARLMETRKIQNIDPKKYWTPKDIDDLKSKYRIHSTSYATWIGENGPEWLTHTSDNDGKVIKTDPAIPKATFKDTKALHEYKRGDDEDVITRYNEEFLRRVFNEVASTSTKDLTRYAQKGMKFIPKHRNGETLQFIRNTNGAIKYDKNKNKPTPEFWDRLRGKNSEYLVDWIDPSKKNSHLMSWGEDNGKYIIYPEVQMVDGKLVDFTRPPYDTFAGMDTAIATGNYITAPNEHIADDFTKNYKKYTEYFPSFKNRQSKKPESSTKITSEEKPIQKIITSEEYIPTIDDLVQFTAAYETFQPLTYKLKNEKTGKMQDLVGYGMADRDLVNKHRNTPISEPEARRLLKDRLIRIHTGLTKHIPNFKNLPMKVQYAITDIAYNGSDVDEILKDSPLLLGMINSGIVDPNILVKEMNHSQTHNSWLGDRSAARRAMALGKYNWNHKTVDKYGRHLDPNKPVGKQDWKSGMYLGNY